METTFEAELGHDLQLPGEKLNSFYTKMIHTVVLIKAEKLCTIKGQEPQDMIGGGMIIDPRGLVLTANHVVEKSSRILMRSVEEHGFTLATLIYADELQDMALIQRKGSITSAGIAVDARVFNHCVKLAPARALVVGMDVYTISHPRSYIYSLARGQLAYPASVEPDQYKDVDCLDKTSIRRRMMDCRDAKDKNLQLYPANLHVIQLNNLHGSPGSSGCPVFNSAGLVIGMEIFINNNFDFCLHANVLKGFIKKGLKCVKEPSAESSKASGEPSRGTGNPFEVLGKSAEGSNKRKSPITQQREGHSRRVSHPMLTGEGKTSNVFASTEEYALSTSPKMSESKILEVRVKALHCLGDLVLSLEKDAILIILQTLRRCIDVDRSPATLACTLGVVNSISKQYDIEFTAEHVLPLLVPLLNARELSDQQFNQLMLFVKDVLSKIEGKRGTTCTNSTTTGNKVSPSVINGLHTEPLQRTSALASSVHSSPKWGEDWASMTKGSAPVAKQSLQLSPGTATSSPYCTSSIAWRSSYIDIECPPSTFSTSFSVQSVHSKNKWRTSDSCFDDIDPFANWPPKPNSFSNNIDSRNSATQSCGIVGSNFAGRGLASNKNHTGILSNAYKGSSNIQNPASLGINSYSEKANTSSGKLSVGFCSNIDSFTSHCMSERAPGTVSIFSSENSVPPGTASIFSSENCVPAPRFAPPQTFGGIAASQTFSGGRGCFQNPRHAASGTSRGRDLPPLVDLF